MTKATSNIAWELIHSTGQNWKTIRGVLMFHHQWKAKEREKEKRNNNNSDKASFFFFSLTFPPSQVLNYRSPERWKLAIKFWWLQTSRIEKHMELLWVQVSISWTHTCHLPSHTTLLLQPKSGFSASLFFPLCLSLFLFRFIRPV